MKYAALVLSAVAGVGCRMAARLEAPQIYSSEFGMPLARAGNIRESDIDRWQKVVATLEWPVTVAVLQAHRDNRYVSLSQEQWDEVLRKTGAVRSVKILDGLGVGDETMHEQVARHPGKREGAPEVEPGSNALFVSERWMASTAKSDLIFVYATKVATDLYWNMWVASWALLVTIPLAPAEQQAAQAVSKGFLIDVKTGQIIETAGAAAMRNRSANPVIVTSPLFELEQQVAYEAESKMISQLSAKLAEMRERAK